MSFSQFSRVCILLIITIAVSTELLGQSYSNINWYFGSNDNSFRFVRPNLTPEAITLPNTLGIGGGAVATDPVSGELWFYTDGIRVYDRSDFELTNALQGSNIRNQGVAICENPANNNEYYIFTIDNLGVIRRSVFDKTLPRPGVVFPEPPEGNLASINAPVPTIAGPLSEGMVIISNSDNSGFWLITHQNGTDIYNVTQIDGSGTFNTTTYTLPTAPTNVANLSYNVFTNRLAVAPADPAESISLLNIDLLTGDLTLSTINLAALAVDRVYDIEWNNSGEIIYVSGNFGDPEDSLMQVVINEPTPTLRPVQTFDMVSSFGLQMGPDSAIYHLYEATDGQFKMGRINDPDTFDLTQNFAGLVLYDPRPLADIDAVSQTVNDINFAAQQFPAFLPFIEPSFTVDFSWVGECQNEETLFFPEISEVADSVFWDFGDGNGSRLLSPVHTYADAQSFTVTLTGFVNGIPRQATDQVTIDPFDITIDVETDTTFCREFFPPPYGTTGTASVVATADNATSITWFNGFTTQTGGTLVPDSSGIYWVVATDGSGCSTSETVTVNTYGENIQRGFVWYFGDRAGIDFNPLSFGGGAVPVPFGDPTVYNGGNQMTTPEGCAIFCDPNGQPLFYSDGVDVYDREGNLLTPVNKIGGSNGSTQSILIVPFPDDGTLFYIFTTQEVYNASNEYNLSYSVFDLKRNNGLGELVPDQNGEITTMLCTGITERITGSENWIIVHEFGNSNFKAFPIQNDGIGNAVISNVGRIHNTDREAQGYMVLSDDNRLAVANSVSQNENFVELFDFDPASGVITEFIELDFNDTDRVGGPPAVSGQVYGIEFSGSNLFATIKDNVGSQVYLWHLDSANGGAADPTYIRDSVEVVDLSNLPAGSQLGAIEAGPDGVLYVAMEGQQQVATINNPNTVFGTPPPIANTFGLAAGTNSNLGLPNFIQDPFGNSQSASITPPNGCSGEIFTFTVENPLDESLELYQVNIFDPDTVLVQSRTLSQGDPTVSYTFIDPGTYTLEFTTLVQCSGFPGVPFTDVTTEQPFVVNPLPEVQTPIATTPPSSCTGNDGSAVITFLTNAQLSYSVSGPVSYAPTTIFSDGNTTVTIPGLTDGGYDLTVVNDITGCSDVFRFIVDPPITYTVTAVQSQQAGCDGTGGEITYSLSGAGAPTIYVWELRRRNDNVLIANGDQNDVTTVISPVDEGDYSFELVDDNDCNTVVDVSITRPPSIQLAVNPGPLPACDDIPVFVDISSNSLDLVEVRTQDGNIAQNVRVVGVNDSLEVTNPGVLTESITYAVTAFGDGVTTCDTTAFFTVSFGQSSPIPFASRYALCPFEQDLARRFVMLENPPNGFSDVVWFDEDGNEITNATPGFRFSAAGDSLIIEDVSRISAELTNIFGCITVADIEIVEDCQGRINAPSAFYPNSLVNVNRQFIVFPFLILPDDFQIYIFNRWGEMVFQSDDLEFMRTQGWNGGYDNDPSRPVPGGAYAYKVEFKSQFEPEKGLQEQRGGVTLIR